MTTSAPLESIAVDTTRRDQWGRYLVVPPTGGKPIGYTRVTTVAKALDNGGGLANWKASQAICGTLIRRGLRAQWEALLAEHGGDPWYANKASKAACKRLVEECAAVGGANDRREMGSSLHTITALADLGSTPTHLSDETAQDLGAYQAGLASAGIKIDPSLIETTVVLDAFQVAGTFDRLAVVPGFDLPLVADLKTGADLSYSWPSISVQLAAYSRADHIYRQGIATDGSQDRRLPMPEVDQRYGLVMWLDAGSNKLELFLVELEPGWEAFEHSIWTRHWRSRRDIAFPLSDLSYDTEVTDRIASKRSAFTPRLASPSASTGRRISRRCGHRLPTPPSSSPSSRSSATTLNGPTAWTSRVSGPGSICSPIPQSRRSLRHDIHPPVRHRVQRQRQVRRHR
jgi:hypothetical protein